MSICVLIIWYLMTGILWQYFGLDLLWLDSLHMQVCQTVEYLHVDLHVWHLAHLLVKLPCIGAVRVNMLI